MREAMVHVREQRVVVSIGVSGGEIIEVSKGTGVRINVVQVYDAQKAAAGTALVSECGHKVMRQLVLEIQRVAVHVWCFEVLRRSPNLDESIVGQAGLGISGEGWIPWIPGDRMDSGLALHQPYLVAKELLFHLKTGSIATVHPSTHH